MVNRDCCALRERPIIAIERCSLWQRTILCTRSVYSSSRRFGLRNSSPILSCDWHSTVIRFFFFNVSINYCVRYVIVQSLSDGVNVEYRLLAICAWRESSGSDVMRLEPISISMRLESKMSLYWIFVDWRSSRHHPLVSSVEYPIALLLIVLYAIHSLKMAQVLNDREISPSENVWSCGSATTFNALFFIFVRISDQRNGNDRTHKKVPFDYRDSWGLLIGNNSRKTEWLEHGRRSHNTWGRRWAGGGEG